VELKDREVKKAPGKTLFGVELSYALVGFLVGVAATALAVRFYDTII
jgi:hypothetical protein